MKRFFLYTSLILSILGLSLMPLAARAAQAQLNLQIFPLECTVDLLNNSSGTLYSVTPENCLNPEIPPVDPSPVVTSPTYPYQARSFFGSQVSRPAQTDWLFVPSKSSPSVATQYPAYLLTYDRYETTVESSASSALSAILAVIVLLVIVLLAARVWFGIRGRNLV